MSQIDGDNSLVKSPLRVTIADVARVVGMSKSTVSRALHLSAEEYPLKPETRKFIAEAAERLGYRRSWAGAVLSKKRTQQIGLLFSLAIPETRGIYGEMLEGLSTTLEARGYSLLFIPVHGPHWKSMIQDGRIDGFAVAHAMTAEMADVVAASPLPSVLLNERTAGRAGSVLPDDVMGSRLAVEHLRALGHEKIAFVRMSEGSVSGHHSIAMRRAGYEQAMRDGGLGQYMLSADEPLEAFLARVPVGRGGYTALLCYTHTEAVKLLPLLAARGIRVPADVSVVCFNDVFPMADLVPAVTAIDVPGRRIGEAGAAMLLDMLEAGKGPHNEILPETLVPRASSAAPAASV